MHRPLALASFTTWLLPVVVAALALAPEPAQAVRFIDVSGYIGGGMQYGWVTSGYSAIDGAQGAGVQLVFGRRLRDRYPLYLDMRVSGIFAMDVGPTTEIAYPSDRADYAVMAVGGLWDFRTAGPGALGAWASVHATYHNLNWRQHAYDLEGFGLSPAIGMHVPVPPLGVFRIGVMGSFFSTRSNYDARVSGQSLQISVDYLHEFRPRDGK
jgi:hypothetical protein